MRRDLQRDFERDFMTSHTKDICDCESESLDGVKIKRMSWQDCCISETTDEKIESMETIHLSCASFEWALKKYLIACICPFDGKYDECTKLVGHTKSTRQAEETNKRHRAWRNYILREARCRRNGDTQAEVGVEMNVGFSWPRLLECPVFADRVQWQIHMPR